MPDTDYLKEFCSREGDVENYIVGTTGDYDPLLSTRAAIRSVDLEYLMGISYEDKTAILQAILDTDREKIRKTLPLFEKLNEDDNVCVIGNRAAIEACGEKLDEIFDLNRI